MTYSLRLMVVSLRWLTTLITTTPFLHLQALSTVQCSTLSSREFFPLLNRRRAACRQILAAWRIGSFSSTTQILGTTSARAVRIFPQSASKRTTKLVLAYGLGIRWHLWLLEIQRIDRNRLLYGMGSFLFSSPMDWRAMNAFTICA